MKKDQAPEKPPQEEDKKERPALTLEALFAHDFTIEYRTRKGSFSSSSSSSSASSFIPTRSRLTYKDIFGEREPQDEGTSDGKKEDLHGPVRKDPDPQTRGNKRKAEEKEEEDSLESFVPQLNDLAIKKRKLD